MRMEEFVQQALTETERILTEKGLDCHVEVTSVVKANDLVKSGLCIRRAGAAAGPNLYLENIYQRYQAGEPLPELIEELIDIFLESEKNACPDAENLDMSFASIKDMLRVRIVDQQANRKFLQTVVHREAPGTGLAFVPEIRMNKDGGFWSSVVTKAMADANGYDGNELLNLAISNTAKYDPPRAFYLGRALFDYEDEDTNLLDSTVPIEPDTLVLTSASGQFGAYAMLLSNVLNKISERIGPFHILPSSRHELIIVPDSLDADETHLREMVREANRTVVSAEDFLSDDIFAYSEATGFRRCSEKILKEKMKQSFVAERSFR